MFIDTHSHIYESEFDEDRDEAIQRAIDANVRYMIFPDIDSKSRNRMFESYEKYSDISSIALGLHPTSVDENYKMELAEVERYIPDHQICAIGECGIDLYWDKTWYKEQIRVFEYQLAMAKELGVPLIVHSRKSLNEIFASLKKYPYVGGVLHCFPGSTEEAKRAIDLGFKLGIGGVVSYKNSSMSELVKTINLKHIILETDSPYLSPTPHRGKRNESAYIPLIAEKIAELKECELKEVEEYTTKNAIELFKLEVK